MHARIDRMKTLRYLLVLVGLIYFSERGFEMICRPVSCLIDKGVNAGNQFIASMDSASSQDRADAESFQRSLDRHNKVSTFVWKRPKGRDLSSRPDEFTPSEIAQNKKFMQQLAKDEARNLARN